MRLLVKFNAWMGLLHTQEDAPVLPACPACLANGLACPQSQLSTGAQRFFGEKAVAVTPILSIRSASASISSKRLTISPTGPNSIPIHRRRLISDTTYVVPEPPNRVLDWNYPLQKPSG